MNLRQIKVLAKLKTMIYSATTIEPTSANIQSIDSDVTLEINGDFMSMVIKYTGIVNIYNKLPDGFSISINQDTVNIIVSSSKFVLLDSNSSSSFLLNTLATNVLFVYVVITALFIKNSPENLNRRLP